MQLHSFQVNRLVSIILKEDREGERKYKYFKDKDELSWKTPLHLVAELNYATVARTILCHYPGQLYITTNPHAGNKNHRYIPLELALSSINDEVSALLIEHMKSERYVFLSPHCRRECQFGKGDTKDIVEGKGKGSFSFQIPPLHLCSPSVSPVDACCALA